MNLQQWQDNMVASIVYKQTTPDLANYIASQDSTAHLAVYRNNVEQALINTLKIAYPICYTLLGKMSFRQLAKAYIETHPPIEANLNYYGQVLSNFIAEQNKYAAKPYLADLVTLEWHLQQSFYAANETPINQVQLTALAAISHEQQANIVFTLRPDISLLSSRFALDRIWQNYKAAQSANTPFTVDKVTAQAQPCYFLIYRPQYQPHIEAIDLQSYIALCAIQQGHSLAELSTKLSDLFMTETLPSYIAKQFITGFYLKCEGQHHD